MYIPHKLIDWCVKKHEDTNHMYDKYLPYKIHLVIADSVAQDFQELLDHTKPMDMSKGRGTVLDDGPTLRYVCRLATWGHDLIEDTRTSYNDVKDHLGYEVADIVYAVTNEKGKNRLERANKSYYSGIRETPGAVFVKLCDRIANVQFSKLTKSRMFDMYNKENPHFIHELGYEVGHPLEPMFLYLDKLFTEELHEHE